jgi:hypothetical protein
MAYGTPTLKIEGFFGWPKTRTYTNINTLKDSHQYDNFLKPTFYMNMLAIAVHAGLFLYVVFLNASPVLITNVSYQVWNNVTKLSLVSDTCSNYDDELLERWDDMEIYPVTTKSGGVNVRHFASLWFLCSALFPLLEALYLRYSYKTRFSVKLYDMWLRTAPVLHFRYFEYSVSATLMIIALYALTGIRDVYTLIFVGVLNSMCMLFGELADCLRRVEHLIYNTENQNTNNVMHTAINDFIKEHKIWLYKYVIHCFGWVHIIVYWIVLLVHLNITKNKAWPCSLYSETIPDFVSVIFGAVFVIFTLFGLVQFYSFIRIGKQPENYYKISTQTLFAYTILSLVGKTMMGAILIQSVLLRS